MYVKDIADMGDQIWALSFERYALPRFKKIKKASIDSQNTDNILSILEKAEEAIRDADFNQALFILNSIENDNKEKGRVLFDYGNIALFKKEHQKAVDYYKESMDNYYQSTAVYLNYAIALERTGEIVKAKNSRYCIHLLIFIVIMIWYKKLEN